MAFLIVFLSFLLLIVLHELGHFLFAIRFGVKVEEFGIGLPPRLFGKKIGETVYSLNLLPLGAFVRLEGEEGAKKSERSFSAKPLWQRMVIVVAGVVAFWFFAALIFTILGASSGIPMAVPDSATKGVNDAKVQIVGIAPDSPAKEAGLERGDIIVSIESLTSKAEIQPRKITEVQEFTNANKGEEFLITIQRQKETKELSLTPRIEPPEGQGPMGVALVRTALVKYAWWQAPFQGIVQTGKLTFEILRSFIGLLGTLLQGKGLPSGVEIMGPVGIVHFLTNSFSLGIPYFFSFFALLSLYLAIFNALPIPAVDGGKLVFLLIEGIRKKPIPESVERTITAAFFALLVTLMIWVTIKDITRIF